MKQYKSQHTKKEIELIHTILVNKNIPSKFRNANQE